MQYIPKLGLFTFICIMTSCVYAEIAEQYKHWGSATGGFSYETFKDISTATVDDVLDTVSPFDIGTYKHDMQQAYLEYLKESHLSDGSKLLNEPELQDAVALQPADQQEAKMQQATYYRIRIEVADKLENLLLDHFAELNIVPTHPYVDSEKAEAKRIDRTERWQDGMFEQNLEGLPERDKDRLRRPALIIRAKKGVILVDKIYHGNKHGKNKY